MPFRVSIMQYFKYNTKNCNTQNVSSKAQAEIFHHTIFQNIR